MSDPPDGAGSGDGGEAWAALHAPFRPVRGRRMAIIIGVAQAVLFLVIALGLSSVGPDGANWWDRLGIVGMAAAIGVLLARFARLSATPDASGLIVRNLSGSRHVDWAQIVSVRFGGGNPWVTLDLSDGDTLAVMAVQRADGPRAEAEARRLATLVDLHT